MLKARCRGMPWKGAAAAARGWIYVAGGHVAEVVHLDVHSTATGKTATRPPDRKGAASTFGQAAAAVLLGARVHRRRSAGDDVRIHKADGVRGTTTDPDPGQGREILLGRRSFLEKYPV